MRKGSQERLLFVRHREQDMVERRSQCQVTYQNGGSDVEGAFRLFEATARHAR